MSTVTRPVTSRYVSQYENVTLNEIGYNAIQEGRASRLPRITETGVAVGLTQEEYKNFTRVVAETLRDHGGNVSPRHAAESALDMLVFQRPVLQPLKGLRPITPDRTQAPREEYRYVCYLTSTEHTLNGRTFSPILFSAKFPTFDEADLELDSLVEARKATGGKIQVRNRGGRWQDCGSSSADFPKLAAASKTPTNRQPAWDDMPEHGNLDEARMTPADYIRMAENEAYSNGWTVPNTCY